MTEDTLLFPTREAFREWLTQHHAAGQGVWLLFGKRGGPETLTAQEALEEALCFGWIDGKMCRTDDRTYRKYFAGRRKTSAWSARNRAIAERLEAEGRMTQAGRDAIAVSRKMGKWELPPRSPITQEQVGAFSALLSSHSLAAENFQKMAPSVQRNYTGLYFDAKTEQGRARRLEKIIGRLDENKKPMGG